MKSLFKKQHIILNILLLFLFNNLNAQRVKLSEIGFNSTHNANTFGAIIEIQNYGDTSLDLTGYSIVDPSTGYSTANERTYLDYETVGCGDDMILEPNEVVSVFRFLNKNSQTIHLYTPDNKLLSSVTWGDSPYFITASESGVWDNGPTPVVPEGGAIVNIGSGNSWLDWVAVSERTPCVAENNSGRRTRKKIIVFEAEDADNTKTKMIKKKVGTTKVAVHPNKEGAYIEWNIEVENAGVYDVFLNYSNSGTIQNALDGVLTVNDKHNAALQLMHGRPSSQTLRDTNNNTWLNEFTRIPLQKGVNSVRFTAVDDSKKNKVLIDYMGLLLNDEQDTTSIREIAIEKDLSSSYCHVQASSAKDEWIANFSLGTIDNNSGSTVFTDFSDLETNLESGAIYEYRITPAWSGTVYNEGYAIWIDYNGNGNFDDEGEKVVSIAPSRTSVAKGSFTIPKDALPGATKIRVAMKYNSEPTLACSPIDNGEIEEYTAKILEKKQEAPKDIAIAKIKPAIALFPLPVATILNIDISEPVTSLTVLNMLGQKVLEAGAVTKIDMKSLPSGNYILVINSNSRTYTKKISRVEK